MLAPLSAACADASSSASAAARSHGERIAGRSPPNTSSSAYVRYTVTDQASLCGVPPSCVAERRGSVPAFSFQYGWRPAGSRGGALIVKSTQAYCLPGERRGSQEVACRALIELRCPRMASAVRGSCCRCRLDSVWRVRRGTLNVYLCPAFDAACGSRSGDDNLCLCPALPVIPPTCCILSCDCELAHRQPGTSPAHRGQ